MPSFSYNRGGTAHVDIEGLSDFVGDLKHMGDGMEKAVIQRGREFGRKVVTLARAKASNNTQAASASKSLRVNSSARGVIVSGGGARSPFFWGAEFGGKRMTMGRKLPGGLQRAEKKKFGGFRQWTGNQHTDAGWGKAPGYFLNPAVDQLSITEWKAYQQDIERLASQAFSD